MNNNLTLSITTIGDLLLRKTITITNSGEPINDVSLCVPIYQRPYKWTARNAIQLLDDIIEAKNSNKERYRVGTLILHKAKDKEQYDIVDGLQRTITFSLLLTALGEDGIEFLQQKIYNNVHNNHNIANNYNALNRRVGLKLQDSDSATEHQREMERLRDYIENMCELIVVITPDVSEAFQFFDSQNARGKALYPHDLLKAYHLREMNTISEDETEKIVKDWEQVSQSALADFFGNYLYRIKEWVSGNKANVLFQAFPCNPICHLFITDFNLLNLNLSADHFEFEPLSTFICSKVLLVFQEHLMPNSTKVPIVMQIWSTLLLCLLSLVLEM